MISKEIIICTKEELERMCKLAYGDAQEGFEFKIKDYTKVLE